MRRLSFSLAIVRLTNALSMTCSSKLPSCTVCTFHQASSEWSTFSGQQLKPSYFYSFQEMFFLLLKEAILPVVSGCGTKVCQTKTSPSPKRFSSVTHFQEISRAIGIPLTHVLCGRSGVFDSSIISKSISLICYQVFNSLSVHDTVVDMVERLSELAS